MMTLEEAIKHCKDVALSCTNKECALEHFQLLKWLQEYSNMLEKQGEQNPDKREGCNNVKGCVACVNGSECAHIEEQNTAWSEEDKVMLDEIIDFFENGTVKLQHDLSLYASWLKSLTGRYTWKPSDDQMNNK